MITIIKKKDLQKRICQRVEPSKDFTINPPKLKLNAPKKIKKGPGSLFRTFIKFEKLIFVYPFHTT